MAIRGTVEAIDGKRLTLAWTEPAAERTYVCEDGVSVVKGVSSDKAKWKTVTGPGGKLTALHKGDPVELRGVPKGEKVHTVRILRD